MIVPLLSLGEQGILATTHVVKSIGHRMCMLVLQLVLPWCSLFAGCVPDNQCHAKYYCDDGDYPENSFFESAWITQSFVGILITHVNCHWFYSFYPSVSSDSRIKSLSKATWSSVKYFFHILKDARSLPDTSSKLKYAVLCSWYRM